MRATLLAVLVSCSLFAQTLPEILRRHPETWLWPYPRPHLANAAQPLRYKVDIGNDHTRVLRLKLLADTTYATHSPGQYLHPGVLVALTETDMIVAAPPIVGHGDHEIKLQPGQSQWVPDDTTFLRNLSSMPAEFLFIEMKSAPPSP